MLRLALLLVMLLAMLLATVDQRALGHSFWPTFYSAKTVLSIEDDEHGACVNARVTIEVPYSEAGTGFYAQLFSDSILSSTCGLEHE